MLNSHRFLFRLKTNQFLTQQQHVQCSRTTTECAHLNPINSFATDGHKDCQYHGVNELARKRKKNIKPKICCVSVHMQIEI